MCYAFRGRVSITYQIDPWSPRIEEKFSNVAIESVQDLNSIFYIDTF